MVLESRQESLSNEASPARNVAVSRQWPGWPVFAADERAAVDRVLASGKVNYWTGEQVREFEAAYARAIASRHAIALANGTVALELALRAWEITAGDEVVVTPRSFMASASAVALQGARPVFADVDLDSQNITAASIEAVLTERTRAILVVHLAGWPCEMDPIMELAARRGLKVLEDCAQAHGATYKGRHVGSLGDAGAFSFCQDKIITTGGEGGLLVTNDTPAWSRAWSFKDHGKSWNKMNEKSHLPGFRWVHDTFGTNWRMTELQGAIGRIQLAKLDSWVEARTRNASVLLARLGSLPLLRTPRPPAHMRHAWYRFYTFLRPERLAPGWSRERILAEITATGVPCFAGSCSEIYAEKAFEGTGWRPAAPLPNARQLGETSLAFLVHPTLSPTDIGEMCDRVETVLRAALGQPES